MRAVVFTDDGERLRDVEEPVPGMREVLLQVEYCGICGSDLHASGPDFRSGVVMGHEFSAVVLESRAERADLRPGDRVVVNPNGDVCGWCAFCAQGQRNHCVRVWDRAVGLARNGALAPLVAVPETTVHALPDEVDSADGAFVEPLAVALRVVRGVGISVGQDAVVFGAGPIGLLVSSILRAAGAARIVVVEPSPGRRALAARCGATDVIDPRSTDVRELFPDAARAPEFAFECSGVAELVGEAARVLRPRGTLAMVGFARRPPSFAAEDVLFKELTIRGSFIYLGEFVDAIDLLARGKIDVAPLVSGIVGIEEAPFAFDRMRRSSDAIKYLIQPGRGNRTEL